MGFKFYVCFRYSEKKDFLESFSGFRPSALCNVVYKMVTKVIAERIKPKLSKFISKEQFGFLSNR